MAKTLRAITPKMDEVFGNLTFGGIKSVNKERNGGQERIVSITYSLFSDVQRADEIEVTIPASTSRVAFGYMEPVRLVGAKLHGDGEIISGRAYAAYIMTAESMLKV